MDGRRGIRHLALGISEKSESPRLKTQDPRPGARINLDLLAELCETPGFPGRVERVRNLIRKHIKSLFDNSRTDSMGSLICTRNPTSTKKSKSAVRVMIAAHMDKIGFYVSHVDDLGYLWVNPAAVVVGTR